MNNVDSWLTIRMQNREILAWNHILIFCFGKYVAVLNGYCKIGVFNTFYHSVANMLFDCSYTGSAYQYSFSEPGQYAMNNAQFHFSGTVYWRLKVIIRCMNITIRNHLQQTQMKFSIVISCLKFHATLILDS